MNKTVDKKKGAEKAAEKNMEGRANRKGEKGDFLFFVDERGGKDY